MKFFTIEWWADCQTDDAGHPHDAITAYRAHIAAVADRLPPALLALQETVSLHDARLLRLGLSVADRTAVLELRLSDGSPLALSYAGVESFESTQAPEHAFPGPGYGDLGYDEVDVLSDGRFKHRLLFATSIEFRLVFRSLELRAGTGA